MPDAAKLQLNNIDPKILEGLSDQEKDILLKTLSNMSKGDSSLYQQLKYQDFDEIPVDIETFLHDKNYLGNGLIDSEGRFTVFPYWIETLKKIFPDNLTTRYNTLVLTGSIGIGKSFFAVLCMLYLLYRMLCLKDPYIYYGLQPIDKITFSFINVTIDAAKGVAWDKIQQLLQSSPWFMSHGSVSGRSEIVWTPSKRIELVVGSNNNAIIGRALFCLDGDTLIYTDTGISRIRDLEGQFFKPLTYDTTSNSFEYADEDCTVQMTATSDIEYQIELEDGTIIKCTPSHRFLLVDGTYKRADELTDLDEVVDYIPYGYIYKTTNRVNGKVYIGQKKSRNFLGQLYLGSGKMLKRAVAKYGKAAFEVELLEFCRSKAELDIRERFYIQEYNSMDPSVGYNIGLGGQGGDQGPIVRQKISTSLKASGKHHTNAGCTTIVTPEGNVRYIKKTDPIPDGCVRGNKQSGCIAVTNGTVDRFIKPDEPIPSGFWLGRRNRGVPKSEETRRKMQAYARSKDKPEHLYAPKGTIIYITNGKINRRWAIDQEIPEGFRRGSIKTKLPDYNTVWTPERRKQWSDRFSGSNNPNYGNRGKVAGGKNGKAMTRYFYEDSVFECRKDLVTYLKAEGFSKVSANTIRTIEQGSYGDTFIKRFGTLIDKLRWERK